MKKQEQNLQDTDALVKRRKWKNRLSVAAIVIVIAAVSAVSIGNYTRTRQAASTDDAEAFGQHGSQDGLSDMVMASGTTSVGVDAVTFEIDFLEDTNLYVEEVYLSNGDSVQAGDKYIKFTDESIADARTELEAAALSASLSYRSGVISNGESRLQAKYTYDVAMLEANYAQQVYEDTVAALEAAYAQAVKSYEEAQEDYNAYYESVQNNSFYEEYDIANLKKAYEEAYDLYVDQKTYYEVTEDELKSSSTDSKEMSALPTLSGSTKSDTSVINVVGEESPDEDNTDTENEPSEGDSEKPSAPDKNERPEGFGSMGKQQQQEAQNAQNDRKWIVRTVTLLEQEMEEAKENYEKALEEYEKEVGSAELNLQKLFNQLETAREDYTDADITYQKEMLSAKTAYETVAAKGKTAQNEYDTQLTSLADSLDRLQDAKEEAEDHLALFEELVGDGYLYTEDAGTVLMIMAQEGQPLAGGSMVLAYSNPKEISVSVSVSQNDIAKLYVGEAANVVISDYGNYNGVIETINPVSSSDSRTSVAYTVTVRLDGDVSGLEQNLTASVIFGNQTKPLDNETLGEKGGRDGRSGKDGKEASDKAD
ncbi:MAG: HlyD family efflux transporter periplasmic adaptor subunit [Lachnospiraceae bacterium]|nr:HlyD family efflux transporter periplasmic adaptor subunit [Lachnospiraceae bacterium]